MVDNREWPDLDDMIEVGERASLLDVLLRRLSTLGARLSVNEILPDVAGHHQYGQKQALRDGGRMKELPSKILP